MFVACPFHSHLHPAHSDQINSVGDLIGITGAYKAATFVDALITPEYLNLPNPYLYTIARVSLWAIYGFVVGLFSTGLWVIAHECGHQAFSESKIINNAVGWVLHSAYVSSLIVSFHRVDFFLLDRLGIPYHSWRISHAKHHASTAHMTQDQVYVPWTRSELKLPPL